MQVDYEQRLYQASVNLDNVKKEMKENDVQFSKERQVTRREMAIYRDKLAEISEE